MEKKWNEKTWGKIIQILIWPLGLYMMYSKPYFTKKTRIILTVLLFVGIGLGNKTKKTNPCDCLSYMLKDQTKYNSCLKNDLDRAFDYMEKNHPNQRYQKSEALIHAYWMEKCNK
jgi:hypothetical protein